MRIVMTPALAALASFVIPGLGQMLSGKFKRGLIFLVPVTILYLLYYKFPIVGLVIFVLVIYATYDAYKITKAKESLTTS
ncbi:DUF6677 family protein [Methanobacterium paludis]|uniref:Uncharacterized protein n=1 Tax=Methanobacterium paludis (strain DSM 25820 / JCM 18151 / SWAN1) TaxID=868131 RepID=F6D6R5_METPW|nr:DUF6677 family protein [Methanobacterium paludis]AEG18348.1 hypothetical protein MSWAN_1333 [Methanobacterium paludis]